MVPTCGISGCDQPIFVRKYGWCAKHYHRWRRTGDPLKAAYDRASGTPEERWWAKVEKQPDGCWLWTGGLDKMGYGQFHTQSDGKRRNHRAHRYGYELLVGPIPGGVEPDHLCRVHACVNPGHLDLVTHRVNVQRGDAGKAKAARTHCPRGHEYTPENTGTDSRRPGRVCVACRRELGRERGRRYRERRRAAAG